MRMLINKIEKIEMGKTITIYIQHEGKVTKAVKIRSLLVLFLLLFLAACSNNNEVEQAKGETVEEVKSEKGEKKGEEEQVIEFPQASTDPMEMSNNQKV